MANLWKSWVFRKPPQHGTKKKQLRKQSAMANDGRDEQVVQVQRIAREIGVTCVRCHSKDGKETHIRQPSLPGIQHESACDQGKLEVKPVEALKNGKISVLWISSLPSLRYDGLAADIAGPSLVASTIHIFWISHTRKLTRSLDAKAATKWVIDEWKRIICMDRWSPLSSRALRLTPAGYRRNMLFTRRAWRRKKNVSRNELF